MGVERFRREGTLVWDNDTNQDQELGTRVFEVSGNWVYGGRRREMERKGGRER